MRSLGRLFRCCLIPGKDNFTRRAQHRTSGTVGSRVWVCAYRGFALQGWRTVAAVAAEAVLLAACARPLLAPADRNLVCEIGVADIAVAPVFHDNALAGPAGGLLGAAQGAAQGSFGGMGAIITMPLGALIGAVGGSVCAAAGMNHPTAPADFEKLLHAADTGALKRALEAELNAARAECSPSRKAGPVATITIEKIDAGMGCPVGQLEYWIAAQWRTRIPATGRELNWTSTRCTLTSFRTVDDWFTDAERARAEIGNGFAAVGRRIGTELVSTEMTYECKLRSDAAGEVVAK
jgi:hypothetical protein